MTERPITRRQARQLRPRVDDPRYLEGGRMHPAYQRWIISQTYEEQHPWSTFSMAHVDHHPLMETGHLDSAAVKRALGLKGPQMLVAGEPIPRERHYSVLAKMLGVKVAEVAAAAEGGSTSARITTECWSAADGCRTSS